MKELAIKQRNESVNNSEKDYDWCNDSGFSDVFESGSDDKLIADFMYEATMPIELIKYRTSWDWLIPVVEKCLNIYHIELMNDDLNFDFYDCIGNKERTYNQVVTFIKQQNDAK